jgi:hypothetical protein
VPARAGRLIMTSLVSALLNLLARIPGGPALALLLAVLLLTGFAAHGQIDSRARRLEDTTPMLRYLDCRQVEAELRRGGDGRRYLLPGTLERYLASDRTDPARTVDPHARDTGRLS